MAEPRRWSDDDLAQALRDLGERLTFPPTPPLTATVRARLEGRQRSADQVRDRRPARRWLLAAAAIVALVLGALVLGLSPAAREAVAERLGLRGVTIWHLGAPSTLTPAPLGTGLQLGERVSLAEARGRVRFEPAAPTVLGQPDEVYVGEPPPGGQVALVYRARPGLPAAGEAGVGLLLTAFRGTVNQTLIGKGLGPGTRIESVIIAGATGYWIEGQPHLFLYVDPGGQVREEGIRLAGNTLLWERDGVTRRLESALGRDEALRIATSIR